MVVMSGRQSDGVTPEAVRGEPLLGLGLQLGVASDVLLAGTTARPLARNHGATLEDLAAPDPPRLASLDCAGEALGAQRALRAERLRELEVGRRVGEPQIWVVRPARQVRVNATC